MTWEAIGAPDDTPFPELGKVRRFGCSACGSRDVTLMPDWLKWGALQRRATATQLADEPQEG